MLLGGQALQAALDCGDMRAWRNDEPVTDLVIGANSIDVTLSNKFLEPRSSLETQHKESYKVYLDPIKDSSDRLYVPAICDKLILRPGDFVLGSVQERFEFDGGVPMIEGRSTMARLGISVHQTAGFGDFGFSGYFTLEIKNVGPWNIVLTVGMRIAQVYWLKCMMPKCYDGKYKQLEKGPLGPHTGEGRF